MNKKTHVGGNEGIKTHQLVCGLLLKRCWSNLVVLRQELVVVCLLKVELHILERLALAKVVVVLKEWRGKKRNVGGWGRGLIAVTAG